MNWFFIALVAPFLHAIVNFIDKILLSKYFKNVSLFVFLMYSMVVAMLVLPFFLLFGNLDILAVPLKDILILVSAGICVEIAMYFYLFALDKDDASSVVPFFQLIPVFTVGLGLVFLHQIPTPLQMVGSMIVILGAVILSLELENVNKISFKKEVVFSVMAMAFLMALAGVLFSLATRGDDFWVANFWEFIGVIIVGLVIFIVRHEDRRAFFKSLQTHKLRITFWVGVSELVTLAGNVALNFAFILAPVFLARTVEGYQPIFVLLFGLLITRYAPHILQEKITTKHLLIKISTIIIIVFGSYLMLA